MDSEERDIRLQVMLRPEEMKAIEEWRFSRRMPSRAAAIRELLRRGLASEGFAVAPVGKPSGGFSVSESSAPRRRRGSSDEA
jgi:hypothetical protein